MTSYEFLTLPKDELDDVMTCHMMSCDDVMTCMHLHQATCMSQTCAT